MTPLWISGMPVARRIPLSGSVTYGMSTGA